MLDLLLNSENALVVVLGGSEVVAVDVGAEVAEEGYEFGEGKYKE